MDLVTGAIGSLLPKLAELLKEEYSLQKGVREKIKSLSRELELVHAVLRKIGDVPPDQLDKLVWLWARDVREASNDMEDIVDTFLVRIDAPDPTTEPRMLRRLRKKVGNLFKKSKARRNISSLIQDINDKLKEVEARHGRYTIHNITHRFVAAATIDPRLENLYKRVTEFVGIDGPRDDLISKLSVGGDSDDASNTKMKVVSIVGFGGLGKTTLAKAVYDQLKPQFGCGAFIPVGRNPDVKKILRDILIGVNEEKYSYSKLKGLDENQLMGKLNEFVKEKRCFIVIDDIWDKELWKLIRCAVQGSHCGSRLVITTRISEVATHACDETYRIQPLSRDNSEKLLYARIFDGEGKYLDIPSAEAQDRILRKCGGVPLAIITIASLLANKPGEDWSEVYNSIGFGHGENNDVDNTRRILSFSYYDLPPHLKSCLLYLSVFPEDQVIEKNDLIWKWVAEGFIIIPEEQAVSGIGLFELGERYFNELINRSMIQPEEAAYGGYIDACSVHDMVLDMIHSLSSNEDFVTVLDGDERRKLTGRIARRLALKYVDVQNGSQLADMDVEKVRSLIGFQPNFRALCSRLSALRLLDMVYCYVEEDGKKGVLDFLGSLLHLRYLRLGSAYCITEMSGEVRYLKFLQTLDLSGSRIEELPEEVGLLTRLVCLRAGAGGYFGKTVRVPDGLIRKLTTLQEVSIYPADTTAQFVQDLGLLRELRVLRTGVMETTASLVESLGNLHNIRELEIDVSSLSIHKGRTPKEAGFISHRHLRFLRIKRLVFSGLPASLAPNLSYLDVKVLVVKDQDMETLSRLPELRCLMLNSCDRKLVTIDIHSERVGYFRKLIILRISGTSIWFDLHNSSGSSRVASTAIMPSLVSLEFDVHVRSIKDASQLGFDKLLGLENLGRTSLQRVNACVYCSLANSSEVEEAEAALRMAASVHPKHPTVNIERQEPLGMILFHKEAGMDVSINPELVNKAWKKLANTVSSGHIQALLTPDPAASLSKVIRLIYTNNGEGLLALNSNAVHKLWKWEHSDNNSHSKCATSDPPQLWQPKNGIPMTNDTADGNPEEATACIALSRNGKYLISSSGSRLSLFNMSTFEIMTTFMPPPPAASFVVFYPRDNNIIAIGMEDSSIIIYNVRLDDVEVVFRGHQKKITGLAFSLSMNVLVSSGAEAQLCVWSMDDWECKNSRCIQALSNCSGALVGDTVVQFHYDQTLLLVVQERQLAVFDLKLQCLCSWFPRDPLPAPVSSAVYSSDSLLIYAGFCDGAIGIFEAKSLTLQCRMAPSAYIPSSLSSDGGIIYPMVVAAHPWKPNQMAVGMSDGAVYVLEPPLDVDIKVGSGASGWYAPSDSSIGSGDSQHDV